MLDNERLNRMFRQVASAQGQLNALSEEFMEAEGIENMSQSPFHEPYELDEIAQKIRGELTRYVACRFQQKHCPNVEIDLDEVIRVLGARDPETKLFFDANLIEEILLDRARNAEALSIEQIWEDASQVLPVVWGHGGRQNVPVSKILNGRMLALRKHVSDAGYSSRHHYYLNSTSELRGLEKLVKVVLTGANPAKVVAGDLFRELHSRHDGEKLFGVKQGWGKVVKYQLFKNSSFKVTFTTEEAARKVAECLVDLETFRRVAMKGDWIPFQY